MVLNKARTFAQKIFFYLHLTRNVAKPTQCVYSSNSTNREQTMRTEQAVDFFGGRRELAQFLGITRQAVEQWGEYVAEGPAYKLQVLTDGQLMVDPVAYSKASK
jgi:hypothetical protein